VRKVCLVAALVLLAGCSGGGGSSSARPETGSTVAGEQSVAERLGIAEVVLAEPEAGPVFSWEPVDGAATYRLVVLDGDGRAYWAWEGPDTTVALGGGTEAWPKGSGAPHAGEGYTWSVSALAADGTPVGISAAAPVLP
jgi:hypothetical protein